MSDELDSEQLHIRLNGDPRRVAPGTTIADLVRELGLVGRPVAVEQNRAVVRRDAHAGTALRDGDVIEVVTLVGGG